MKMVLPILLLVAGGPALGEAAAGKADKPVIYDRNSRQVLPYDRMPVLCPRSDLTPPGCVGAQKPKSRSRDRRNAQRRKMPRTPLRRQRLLRRV